MGGSNANRNRTGGKKKDGITVVPMFARSLIGAKRTFLN
jgi:hypothetical protein